MRCEHCGELVRMQQPLTRKQRAILDYLIEHLERYGFAPTFAIIAMRFDYRSLATVHEHLGNLERKGWIVKAYNEARSITVLAA